MMREGLKNVKVMRNRKPPDPPPPAPRLPFATLLLNNKEVGNFHATQVLLQWVLTG